jgi:RimJ/RimL family protein N-acetyltransferase
VTEEDLNRPLVGAQLHLQPLTAAHARHLYEGLCDMRLYALMPDEPPASLAALEARYAKLEARISPDGKQRLLNWAAFDVERKGYIGRFEATALETGHVHLAYIVFSPFWRHGYGREGVALMLRHFLAYPWLESALVEIPPDNMPSRKLVESLNFVIKQEPIDRLTDPTGTDIVYELRRPSGV